MSKIPYFKPRCTECGKVGSARHAGTSSGGAPNIAPTVAGKCPVTGGKHIPVWELA